VFSYFPLDFIQASLVCFSYYQNPEYYAKEKEKKDEIYE